MNAGPRGEARRRGAIRALRLGVPAVRADLPPDDARRGRRLCGRRRHQPGRELAYRDVVAAWRNYLAHSQQGPPVRPDRPQPGQPDAAAADRPRDRERPGRRGAHEARDDSRLQRARAAGQARRRHVQEDAAVQPRRARPAASSSWTSFREKNPPPEGAMFGYRRPARHDGRLRQSGAAGLEGLGEARQLLVRALDASGAGRADHTGRARAPPPTPYLRTEGLVSARCINDGPARLSFDPHQPRAGRETDRPYRRRSRACSACSCPAGACTLPTSPKPRAT